jgi:hypothetical protein
MPTLITPERGSPAAIADCKQRQREAQKAAHAVLTKADPDYRSEWAANEATYAEGDERCQ